MVVPDKLHGYFLTFHKHEAHQAREIICNVNPTRPHRTMFEIDGHVFCWAILTEYELLMIKLNINIARVEGPFQIDE